MVDVVAPSRDHDRKHLDPFSMHRQPLEKAETMSKTGDEPREAKSAQALEPKTFQRKNRSVPAEAIEGVVKRIDLARPDFF